MQAAGGLSAVIDRPGQGGILPRPFLCSAPGRMNRPPVPVAVSLQLFLDGQQAVEEVGDALAEAAGRLQAGGPV
jgi:hypothetical protein